jgi:hypothetical protein
MTDKLFLTDGEIAARLGVKTDTIKEKLEVLERSGFPRPDPQFENRRYWPAVKAWLDRRFNLAPSSQSGNLARNGDGKW